MSAPSSKDPNMDGIVEGYRPLLREVARTP